MKVGDIIIVTEYNDWSDKGALGKVIEVDERGCMFTHSRGKTWLNYKRLKVITFKTYLCLLNKDQPLKSLIKDTTQTLLGK